MNSMEYICQREYVLYDVFEEFLRLYKCNTSFTLTSLMTDYVLKFNRFYSYKQIVR